MTYRGRCQCGAIEAAIEGEPVAVRQCWCRQCQRVAAGGPTNNAMFDTDDVVLSAALSTWSYVAASGNTLTQSFCGGCGTPVMAQSSARPQFRTIRLGFLDADLRPTVAIWTEEAPPGTSIDPGLGQYPRQAPPPPPAKAGAGASFNAPGRSAFAS